MKRKQNRKVYPQATSSIAKDEAKLWQQDGDSILSDVLGSYTGNPEEDEQPQQDADDL